MKKIRFYNFLILLSLCTIQCKKLTTNTVNKKNDSINIWIKKAKNEKLRTKKRNLLLQKAYSKNTFTHNDSLKAINLSSIAYGYFNLNDSINFFKINNKAFELANKINNSYVLGDTHWSFANFYKKRKNFEKAYYHFNSAYKYFQQIKNSNNSAIMLYGMAFIKGRYRDYTGSEILTIEAIKLFNQTKNNKRLFFVIII
nr:hypothetical protein BACY1_32400 [Tenacibaculum mesophilum]